MAYVTKTITEAVDGSGNPSVTTSLYFTSFEDFMEYERVVNGSIADPMDFGMEDEPKERDPRWDWVSQEDEERPLSANPALYKSKELRVIGMSRNDVEGEHKVPVGTVVTVVDTDYFEPKFMVQGENVPTVWINSQDLEEI